MGAFEDVCEDLEFSDLYAQIPPPQKKICQHYLKGQDKDIKKPRPKDPLIFK